MKRIFLLFLFLALSFTLFSCNREQPTINHNDANQTDDANLSDYPNDPPTYTLKTYSSTNEYGNAGTYSAIEQEYHTGDSVDLEATVNPGYNFVGWFINDICVSEKTAYTFTVNNEPVEIEARYDYYTVSTISYSDEQGTAGSYTKMNDEKVSIGQTVTLVATVQDGFNFEGWYIDGVRVCDDLTYQFVMEKSNRNITAEYSYYTVSTMSYSDEQGTAGSFTKMNEEKVSIGQTVTLVATVQDGFNFEGWYIEGVRVCDDLTYQFVMENENKNITAEYSYYTFTTSAYVDRWPYPSLEDVIGTYTEYQNEKISADKQIKLVATVGEGYTFKGWYINDICVSDNLEYTYTMTKSNTEVVAMYTYYTVNTDAFVLTKLYSPDFWSYDFIDLEISMGDFTKYKEQKIRVGETVTLIATPKNGYQFMGWKHGGTIVCQDTTFSFLMEAEDISYTAVFIPPEGLSS